MALTPTIHAPQGRSLGVFNVPVVRINGTQGRAFGVARALTPTVDAEQGRTLSAARVLANIQVQQGITLAVVKGHVENPKVRVFTFTLDQHDFYIVQLGDKSTLVYDTYSQQWPAWATKGQPFWRANCGMNWLGAQKYGPTLGSNIVIGDDTFGLLWFLDPNQAYDDAPASDSVAQQEDFPRITMGQVTARGREFVPCYALFLDGDNFGLSAVDFTPAVTMSISDNQGIDFTDLDTIDVILDPDDACNGYIWTSLGQISSPGRLFRITDNGVFRRIDSLEMNDG